MKAETVTGSYIQCPSIKCWRATKELTYVQKFNAIFWEQEQYLFLKSLGLKRADWTLKITSFNPTILGHKILSFWESLKYVFCLDVLFHPDFGRLQGNNQTFELLTFYRSATSRRVKHSVLHDYRWGVQKLSISTHVMVPMFLFWILQKWLKWPQITSWPSK